MVAACNQIDNRESIVYRDDRPALPPGKISLYDYLFKGNPNNLSEDLPLYLNTKDIDNPLTYSKLKEQAHICAASLKREFGLQRGDVISLCSPSTIQHPIFFYASIIAGFIFNPMNLPFESTSKQISQDVDTIRPKLMIFHHSEKATFKAAKDAGVPNILFLDSDNPLDIPAGYQTVNNVLLSSEESAEPYPYTEHDIVKEASCIFFTSGSTGKKKAVMITQHAMISYLEYNGKTLKEVPRVLAPVAMGVISALISCFLFPTYYGMTVYILHNYESSLDFICSAVEKYKINLLSLVPYMFYGLVKDPELAQKYDLSSLYFFAVGGASVEKELIKSAIKNTGVMITNRYGMTECFTLFENTQKWTMAGSIGRPGSRCSARIVNISDGRDLPPGELGELRLKGPTSTIGYYRDPKTTAELFDEQGYIKTGDICKVGPDGLFYYVARIKDFMRYLSMDIHPVELESAIITHPWVSECAVVGVYSKELATEIPTAYVTLIKHENRDKHEILKEIQNYANSQLLELKHVRRIFELESFPRTVSEKIRRFDLRQWANGRSLVL